MCICPFLLAAPLHNSPPLPFPNREGDGREGVGVREWEGWGGEGEKEGEDRRGGVRTWRREERRRERSGAGEHGVRASHNVTGRKKFE